MMASSSINYHSTLTNPPPLLLTFVINEVALSSQSGLEDFLNDLSVLEAQGIYLIIRRNSQSYPVALDPVHLENLLYLVYALAEINEYEVICGYSDFEGILLQAVGARAFGCGWYGNLRQFSFERFAQSTGGQRPRPRYSSLPLLNSILINELDNIAHIGNLGDVLSNSPYDTRFASPQSPSNTVWTQDDSFLHHWNVLRQGIDALGVGTIEQRLDRCNDMIAQAGAIYNQLIQNGVAFEVGSGNRNLNHWRLALAGLRHRLSI